MFYGGVRYSSRVLAATVAAKAKTQVKQISRRETLAAKENQEIGAEHP